ncbi:hypothetical protein RND81_12G233400 [Saponaria officinalis]|uniref:RING-type domain-containing protein n=1 Tax=Saponaria officinalis TaxID=3572 RepID=A0AAW1HEC2_SAPOF
MTDLNSKELLYVAGIGLFVNIILFATTLLISICKKSNNIQNTDIEAFHEEEYYYNNIINNNNDLNVGLLEDNDNKRNARITEGIPSMEFCEIKLDNKKIGCPICLKEGYEDEEICKKLPSCNHVFHCECIDQWFKIRFSCPVCRLDFRTLV